MREHYINLTIKYVDLSSDELKEEVIMAIENINGVGGVIIETHSYSNELED
jgi:hypothetical protein